MKAKQAVIVIHGIGEQVPMETLRKLITGLGFEHYSSRPDRFSRSTELRRIVLHAKEGSRPRTDFYELYWAHLMHGSKGGSNLFWVLKLMFRRKGWRNTPIAPAMRVLTLLTLFFIASLGWLTYLLVTRTDIFSQALTLLGMLAILTATLLIGRVSYLVSNIIADAARYLTPRPANIQARAHIRKQGVDLLRRLHNSGEYQRVVVIGHSLGSVIGYDILRNYWDEARLPDPQRSGKQSEAKTWRETVEALPIQPTGEQMDQFRQAQHRLWREQRSRGVPWLVTDFITLGSPLTHASMLLTTKHSSIDQAKRDLELPACPPVCDVGQNVPGFYQKNLPLSEGSAELRSFYIADPGALFAATRWANLYFPVHHIFGGDLVGGPLAPTFGPGVYDIPVRRTVRKRWKRIVRSLFPFPHVSYWLPSEEEELSRLERRSKNRERGDKESNQTLIHVIDLETERAKEPWPPADSPHSWLVEKPA